MSTADHTATDRSVRAVVAELDEAEFVQFVTAPDGDAVAATGVLAQGLSIPFQARVARATASVSEADVTVAVGQTGGDVSITGRPLSVRAVEITQKRSSDTETNLSPPLRILALAGIIAAERDIEDYTDVFGPLVETDERPGLAIPTTDPVDGLAHTTLAHAPFSGDPDATAEVVAEISETERGRDPRVLASMLAVSVVDEPDTHASTAIERALHPCVVESDGSCPFVTLAGYADVLDALARSNPGEGLALALGHGSPENALAYWREHSRNVHDAVRNAELDRHPECVVVDLSGIPVSTVEPAVRLVREYRSPEPVVLATTDDGVVATTQTRERDVRTPLASAVSAVEDETTVTERGRYAHALIAPEPQDTVVNAFREAI
ncbi:recombinase RecJ [Halocatena salina]|uniref:Recombinase RecJ n=1 Tax=Halocatena salina TaxID=2934340 RepID=A0A8U0A7C6_9EURY|nr:recombinase RecJ [Halocatena salina]UPM43903.1 recombinase RecJ [Halocatena salina]